MEIDLTTLGFLSSATTAFIKESDNLTHLIPTDHPFFSIENAIKGKEDFPQQNRQILVETLRAQYAQLNITGSEIVNNNIDALLEKNTYTVTTGQQLHLFMGPAFMVYKLLSTIRMAEHYRTQYPDKKFVPIYWLASEDHDFAEIKNTPLFGQNYEWQTDQSGACGNYHLKDLPPLFEQLKVKLSNDGNALELISKFEEIYNSSENLSEATMKLTHHLFGQHGLLCLDANNRALKTLLIPIIEKEAFERKSEKAFNDLSTRISEAGLSLQLKSRPINLFYLKENLRSRLEYKDGTFSVSGTDLKFTEDSLRTEIAEYPERFSPNAVLRPLYQETILPNVAYIGGNAEINYWLQLKEIFDLYKTIPCKLVLRQSLWLLKPKQDEWLKSKQITVTDLFKLKTPEDYLNAVAQSEVENPYSALLSEFGKLKDETLTNISKDGIKNLREVSESGKQFEKNLKDLVNAKNDLFKEKNKKDLSKLEQLQNSGFSTKIIQERTTYTIEFLINVKNYINLCHNNISSKPGTGYFLPLQ